jgi:hypothetical protein
MTVKTLPGDVEKIDKIQSMIEKFVKIDRLVEKIRYATPSFNAVGRR